eukprot:m.199411 g.199411  ORF g.199411 m.199411 type:complete len:150 (+) comp10659_c0_seq1:237-686(+)
MEAVQTARSGLISQLERKSTWFGAARCRQGNLTHAITFVSLTTFQSDAMCLVAIGSVVPATCANASAMMNRATMRRHAVMAPCAENLDFVPLFSSHLRSQRTSCTNLFWSFLQPCNCSMLPLSSFIEEMACYFVWQLALCDACCCVRRA